MQFFVINLPLLIAVLVSLLIVVFWIIGPGELIIRKSGFSSRTKRDGLDLFQYRGFFFEIGLIVACTFAYFMLEWTVYPEAPYMVREHYFLEELQEVEIIRTSHTRSEPEIKPVPARPHENIVIEPVSGDELLEIIDKVILDDPTASVSDDPNMTIALPPVPPVPDLDEPEVPLIIAEQMPRFPGCEALGLSDEELKLCSERKLFHFLTSNIHYPVLARENGIRGTVVIQFVVGKDGGIKDALVARDVAGGCGEEALRVVELMRENGIRWIPGRQGGRAVSVRFSLPVKFELN